MTQTWALLLDAYRELNARKMFWITLILSGVVMCALLLVGISEDNHLRIFIWTTPITVAPQTSMAELLKAWFVYLGITIWLTWAAAILALISTASIFPDFLSGGAIELVLSKPISRIRLFLTKYVGGLLFVALQVTVFSLVAFLIIGLRSGLWEFGIFLAVPLVVVFFSYLFAICTFWGVLTRSTIAALLATILIWIMLFVLNAGDNTLLMPRMASELYVEKVEAKIAALEGSEDSTKQTSLAALQKQLAHAQADEATWRKWHRLVYSTKTLLPKTSETIKLLERWLIKAADLPESSDDDRNFPFMTEEMWAAGVRPNEVIERAVEAQRGRSVWWVLGTSLAFEIVVLGAACFIFVRRDY